MNMKRNDFLYSATLATAAVPMIGAAGLFSKDRLNMCGYGAAPLEKAGTDFEYGARLTETCLLGNIAKRVNGLIRWDDENMRVTNNEEANQYVGTEYREGWSL